MLRPDEKEVRAMFEGLAALGGDTYSRLNLNDAFVGFCIAKGMAPKDAVEFVKQNPVQEDGR